jgi:xanthine/uracil permease
MQLGFGWVGALLEALAVGCAYWLFLQPATRRALPALIRPLAPVILSALLLLLGMTMFPPAIAPWWGQPKPGSNFPRPKFAFILDSRFDASQHVPELAVNRTALVREWLGTSALAIATCLLLAATSKRRREERLT